MTESLRSGGAQRGYFLFTSTQANPPKNRISSSQSVFVFSTEKQDPERKWMIVRPKQKRWISPIFLYNSSETYDKCVWFPTNVSWSRLHVGGNVSGLLVKPYNVARNPLQSSDDIIMVNFCGWHPKQWPTVMWSGVLAVSTTKSYGRGSRIRIRALLHDVKNDPIFVLLKQYFRINDAIIYKIRCFALAVDTPIKIYCAVVKFTCSCSKLLSVSTYWEQRTIWCNDTSQSQYPVSVVVDLGKH